MVKRCIISRKMPTAHSSVLTGIKNLSLIKSLFVKTKKYKLRGANIHYKV